MKTSLLALTACLIVSGALAVPPKKPTRPAIPPPANRPIVLGTKQLPGDFGKIGTTYTVGKADPLNITVLSASYTIDRFMADTVADGPNTSVMPPAGKKRLVVRMTVQNPNKADAIPSLSLTAVTPEGNNSEWPLSFTARTMSELSKQTLKPGQKIDVIATILVDGQAPVHKLLIGRGGEDQAAVVRYDLRGKIATLPTWAGAGPQSLDTIAGIRDCVMPAQHFDIGVRGYEWTDDKLDSEEGPSEGFRFLVVHLSFYGSGTMEPVNGGTLGVRLVTDDNQKLDREFPGGVGGFLLARRNASGSGELGKGERADYRIYFKVPRDVQLKHLLLKDEKGSGRTFSFPMGQDWFEIRDCVRSIRGPLAP